MDETTEQIEQHIQSKQGALNSNLEELENKVKSAIDWRQYFQKHPGAMIAAAFGGGVLLSAMIGANGSSDRAPAGANSNLSSTVPPRGAGRHEVSNAWNNIKAALVGLAAAKVQGMVGEFIPGFADQIAKSDAVKHRSPVGSSGAETPACHSGNG
jgi:hypothetical protein